MKKLAHACYSFSYGSPSYYSPPSSSNNDDDNYDDDYDYDDSTDAPSVIDPWTGLTQVSYPLIP